MTDDAQPNRSAIPSDVGMLQRQLTTPEIMHLVASSIVAAMMPVEIVLSTLVRNKLADKEQLKARLQEALDSRLPPEVKSMTAPVWNAIIKKLDEEPGC